MNRPSYLDMKMGTNCVLRSKDSKSYQGFREYDLATTSWQHGYRVTGYCLNHKNEVIEHVCENYTNSQKPYQVKETLRKLFTSPQTGQLMSKALFD